MMQEGDSPGNKMTCRMPAVVLFENFTRELEQSESGKIDDPRGSGVAIYRSLDGKSRADIYVGLILDGFTLYRNISSVASSIRMQFAIQPTIQCHTDVKTFTPYNDHSITIKVLSLTLSFVVCQV